MVYNLELAKRISTIMGNGLMIEEKKIFGGVGYLIQGNMACGVHKDKLIVRGGPKLYEKVLAEQNCSVFDITGHPMIGWVMVDEKGFNDQDDLEYWVSLGVQFASALPLKLT